jgi:hypothetical protein
MDISTVHVDANDFFKSITIDVHIDHLRSAIVRGWIGLQLLKLAALVLKCDVDIKEG